jgi:hypothetical protein
LLIDQLDGDRSERLVGHAADSIAAPDRRRGRRSAGGGEP